MKKLIILLSFLSLFLTAITFSNLRLDQLEEKLIAVKQENIKLKHQLNFFKSEWEYVSSPENIEQLSKTFLELETISLIDRESFIKLLNYTGEK